MTSLKRSSEVRVLWTRCISHAQELLYPRSFVDSNITAVQLSSLTHALSNIISWWSPVLVHGDSLSKVMADSRSLSEEDWLFLLDTKLILLIGDVLSLHRAPRHMTDPLKGLHDTQDCPLEEERSLFAERQTSDEDADGISLVDNQLHDSEQPSRRTSWSSDSSYPGRKEGLPYAAPKLPPAQSTMLEFATVVVKAVNRGLVPARMYSR
jgi:hypothetical protein